MKVTRIIVADDHGLIRDGISAMLRYEDDIKVVAEAENGLEALIQVDNHQPDIVLMDVMMPEMNGIEATKRIKEKYQDVKIVLMSMEISEEFISEALTFGISGYLPKDVRKEVLLMALRGVSNGDEYFDPKVSEAIFKNYKNKKTGKSSLVAGSGNLGKREEEVLTLICQGLSNKEISNQLYISIRTVDSHKTHIMEKLGLQNTVELVKFAIKNGFTEL